jgi:hypothetical protein
MWFKRKAKKSAKAESNAGAAINPIDLWHYLLGKTSSWVLYKNGTCVKVKEIEGDLAAQANTMMRQYGTVYPGSPAGDFSVITPKNFAGWVVGCHHPNILTYVAANEMEGKQISDVKVGLLGRSKRHRDAEEMRIIHIEDNRAAV